jgi:predicted nucleotidyltransferase
MRNDVPASLCEGDGPVQDEAALASALREAVSALEAEGVRYVLVGGLASALLGRPRFTSDVDLFVGAEEAEGALDALARAGFETARTNPHWIYKAARRGVVVDLLFWLKGGFYLDDELVARSLVRELGGVPVRVAPPEFVVATKAIAHDEPSGHHWHDALGVLAACELDWDYLLEQAQHGARRVLALLVYAQAEDLVVPNRPVGALFEAIYGEDRDDAPS